eukprot:88511-Pleurochrysis_carterae.AAC.8
MYSGKTTKRDRSASVRAQGGAETDGGCEGSEKLAVRALERVRGPAAEAALGAAAATEGNTGCKGEGE